ncbi:uncharacterized protein [Physcomitrium patens]|uniref:uncharacterized protein n=1 Tax=Physcomitrium patens TaxID=3218 RepID=UPI003CCCC92E
MSPRRYLCLFMLDQITSITFRCRKHFGSHILQADRWSEETLLCNASSFGAASGRRNSCCSTHDGKQTPPACFCFQQRPQDLQTSTGGVWFSTVLQIDSPRRQNHRNRNSGIRTSESRSSPVHMSYRLLPNTAKYIQMILLFVSFSDEDYFLVYPA